MWAESWTNGGKPPREIGGRTAVWFAATALAVGLVVLVMVMSASG
jgi:hypothetical protein